LITGIQQQLDYRVTQDMADQRRHLKAWLQSFLQ